MKFIVLTTLVFQIVLNVTDLLIVSTVKPLNNGDPWYFFIIWWCLLLFRGKSLQIYKDVHDWKNWVQLNRSCLLFRDVYYRVLLYNNKHTILFSHWYISLFLFCFLHYGMPSVFISGNNNFIYFAIYFQ